MAQISGVPVKGLCGACARNARNENRRPLALIIASLILSIVVLLSWGSAHSSFRFRVLKIPLDEQGAVGAIRFSPDGKTIVAGILDNLIFWDITDEKAKRIMRPKAGDVNSIGCDRHSQRGYW